MLSRMGREARIGAEMDHANVVRSFQVGHVGDAYYLAMEALHGETLESKLKREGHLPYQTACRLIRDVARGLAHLHANEVIHRDVRPANIWITERGAPKVMEFGAAVDALAYIDNLDEEDTETPIGELIVGRYDYMPPEQVYNPQSANATSDLYALGSTFYHCLTGRPPFVHRDPVRQVLQHVYEVAQPPSQRVPGIPHPIDDTVGGMLAKDPSHRFQKAEDVVFALDQYVEEPVEAEPVVVVDVSPEYLEWARATHPHETKSLSDDTVGVTPELIGFLDFMAARNARARRGGRRRVGNR
jgi:serine/threonine-protein kinase